MLMKKTLCLAFGMGLGLGAYYVYNNMNSVDQKVRCLKRKLKKLERDMSNAFNSLNSEQMQKYKSEIETKYKEIKNKIDNLTIKDIKNKAGEALETIKRSITDLSSKISSLLSTN